MKKCLFSGLAALGVSGQVRDADNLLTDDFRETRFGDPDCTAAVLDANRATQESTVTLLLK